MGSSCSSGQSKDKDSVSVQSEGSPCYQSASKKQENHAAATPKSHNNATNQTTSSGDAGGDAKRREGAPNKLVSGTSVPTGDSMSLSSPTAPTLSPRGPAEAAASPEPKIPLPKEMLQLPEHLQYLMQGNISAVQPIIKSRKVTIYVCAADSQDCRMEKGVLHSRVYPQLRRYCLERGYELHITDLHWKAEMEKKQDHEFPELCLGELNRQMETSYVVPIVFLSNSLGSPMLPKTVECQDFEMGLTSVEKSDDKALLQKWYKLDSHSQPPCYRLQPISAHISAVQSTSSEERDGALAEWSSIVERIFSVFVTVFPQELRDTYLTTVVEQEVHNSVCMSRELARRCLWVCRVFTHIQSPHADGSSSSSSSLEQKRRLEVLQNELRTQLAENHILRLLVKWQEGGLDPANSEHAAYFDEVAEQLQQRLRCIIDNIVEEDSNKALQKPAYGISARLFQELMQQTYFCQRAAQCSVNREGVLAQIQKYVSGNSRRPMVVYGPSGCGKTTLVARAAQCCQAWLPHAQVVIRFVGITPESSTMEQLLHSILHHCSILATGRKAWSDYNIESYSERLNKVLSLPLPKRIIIFLDGIDQVRSYGSQSVQWVFDNLPENVKMVLSVNEDSSQLTDIKAKLNSEECLLKIPALQKTSAQEQLVSSIMQYNHSVNSQIQDCVKDCLDQCTTPLYVKVLAWQTSCHSEKCQEFVPKSKLEDEMATLFADLEDTLGKTQVEHALGLLIASKFGLSDSEAIDLLARDDVFHSDVTYLNWAPACLFWSRLHKWLWPFLEWTVVNGFSMVRWRDRQVLDKARQIYLGSDEHRRRATTTLLNYFQGVEGDTKKLEGRLCEHNTQFGSRYHRRKLDELPYQEYQLNKTLQNKYLFEFDWLYDKLCGSDIFQVLEDVMIEQSGEHSGAEELKIFRQLMEQSGEALNYDGRQLYSQVEGRLRPFLESQDIKSLPRIKSLVDRASAPPTPSLLPLPNCLKVLNGETIEQDSAESKEAHIEEIYRMRSDDASRYVVTASSAEENVVVWDVLTQEAVRTLKGITNPTSLQMIDAKRAVLLCGRELQIFDLDMGTFLCKLKGVMNQKMPYFGLHDDDHLVTLSRNRMYVNLMNVTSGDCVTTFKVGEDRFLNSLLVSENGKILVCGDETQKPFPLLVWDLTARKLLYDLRIPHHEFVTSLAAITNEGHYVSCVCREVEEPSPNFIIVYDLQSGTLFKKWKPGVNTVSIAISSQETCVISGLEDARILVWDLVTGNCQWTLTCHRAPVDTLRLDQAGQRCLSCDSQGRDRSLCLWDLTRGSLLAVFTPDYPVTACELTTDGEGIVLGLRGRRVVTTLVLRHTNRISDLTTPGQVYGIADNTGKTFDLSAVPR